MYSTKQLKQLDIRLTDIWVESEKEMIKMRNKINHSNDCQNAIEFINKHLFKCNESLVAIIEKCHIDCDSNSEIIQLINGIKEDEKCIEKWKKKLHSIKCQNKDNYRFNDQNIVHIINSWRNCKPIPVLTEDKCIQTQPEVYLKQMDIELNEVIHKSNDSSSLGLIEDVITQTETDFSLKNENNIEFNTDFKEIVFSDVIISNVKRDIDLQLNDNNLENNLNNEILSEREDKLFVLEEDGNSVSDGSDGSDYDYNYRKRKNRKNSKSTKKSNSAQNSYIFATEKSKRQKRIDETTLPFRVGKGFKCKEPDCEFSCTNKRLFYSHLTQHKREVNELVPKPLKSPFDKSEEQIDEMLHPFKVEDGFECREPDCDFKVNDKNEFYRHYIKHRKYLKCLEDVQLDEFLLQYKVDTRYHCSEPECSFTTGVKKLFRRHYNQHKGKALKRSKALKPSPQNPRPYVCDWPGCDMSYKKPQHLKDHRMRHINYRPFTCDWPGCGFKMAKKHDVMTHRRTHTQEKPLQCDWPGCEYKCNVSWSLKAHKRKHTGEKPYECSWPDCHYRCSQPGTLILHKRKHTGEKPYMCKDCGKRFSVLAGLHLHRPVHQKETNNRKKATNTKKRKKEVNEIVYSNSNF